MSNAEIGKILLAGGLVAGLVAIVMGKRSTTASSSQPVYTDQTSNIHDDMDTNTKLPRGYRNNNPLNIRISGNNWQGKIPVSENTDGVFEQFETMAHGYRAAMVLLRNYINRYKCDTLAKIITRWAPPKENNTQGYIERVAKSMGVPSDTFINPYSQALMSSLVYAMSLVENGTKITPPQDAIREGWELYA